jgi:hypothetical protein
MRHYLNIALLLVAFNSFASFHPGTIIYKNGKSRAGFIEAKLGTVVRFKPWMEAEAEEIASTGLKTVLLKTDSGRQQREYHLITVFANGKKSGKDPLWMKLLEKGIVTLYLHETVSRQDGLDTFEPGEYFCVREGEEGARQVASYGNNHSFQSKGLAYFADCNEVVEKIKAKQYTWENIQEVVRSYNQWLAGSKSSKQA